MTNLMNWLLTRTLAAAVFALIAAMYASGLAAAGIVALWAGFVLIHTFGALG